MIIGLHGIVNKITTAVVDLIIGLFAAWNGEISGVSLDTNIYRVYNGDNVNDVSGNAQNGTNVNNVTFTTGKVGNAFTFNSSNYIELPNNSLNLTSSFSIGFWMNLQGVGNDSQSPISNFQYNGGVNYYGWSTYIQNNNLRFTIYNGTATDTFVSYGIGPQYYNWNYFQLEYDWGVQMRIKINGVIVSTLNTSVTPVYGTSVGQTHTPTIGCWKYNGGTTNYFLRTGGKIDALTVWNRTLTSGESISLYNNGVGVEYPYSSYTLPTLNDAVGTNHGIISTSTLTGGVYGPTFTTGKIGKAFSFDGVNDYIELPNNTFNSLTGDFSISFWYYYGNNSPLFKTAISTYNNNAGSDYGWELDISGNGAQPYFALYGTSTVVLQRGNTFNLNQWNHFVLTRKGSTGTKMYHNGVEVIANTSTINPRYHTTMYASIGALKYGASSVAQYMYAGNILDALTVWNKELSATEITALYNSGNGLQLP